MSTPRETLYRRLPEIYRIRDGEQFPAGQLEAYLGIIDGVHAAIRDSIEALGHDLFIETCADWVIPYLGDLLGTSHLAGDPWTLRADVARTIHHRRRKGTLGAIESLTHTLTGWAVHTVEMRERLLWNQHLNHQRPDAGGVPPLSLSAHRGDARWGGTVNVRDPALLSLLAGPFDPFAHVVDVKCASNGQGLFNLPNLAIFLWRLEAYTVTRTRPGVVQALDLTPVPVGDAPFAVRVELHPQAEPMQLFNTHRFHADDEPPNLTSPDAVPGPMPWARLTEGTPAGRPHEYVEVLRYPTGGVPLRAERLGLTLHVPEPPFTAATTWSFRGANLCGWEAGLRPPLRTHEIVVDPDRGRVLFGVAGALQSDEADPLAAGLFIAPTHGFAGPVGAQPIPRAPLPGTWITQVPLVRVVDTLNAPGFTLEDALANLSTLTQPLIIEIRDSLSHSLDLSAVAGSTSEGGLQTLRLARSLWIRAADGERPVVRLVRPLAFRPDDVLGPGAPAILATLTARLEGLYVTRAAAFPASDPLIARAALSQLVVESCTLDPGGFIALDGTRAPLRDSFHLDNSYGFSAPAEATGFDQTPELILQRTIAGPLAVDDSYRISLEASIIDAGSGLGDPTPELALRAATGNAEVQWGPPLALLGMTCFGRMRVQSVSGSGGIWLHALSAHDTQIGCVKFSRFAQTGNRLPSHHGCVFGTDHDLRFVAETFGKAGYAQLGPDCDRHILEQGPNNDEMGAFGFLLNSHKWKNVQIRYREYMPIGIRPILITVT
jgi:hypothetical protein